MAISDSQLREMFENRFHTGSSGCVRTCACKRVTYNPDGDWTWEEGELQLLEMEGAIPSDYSVTSAQIFGHEYVFGCPCGATTKTARWIEDNKEKICGFLSDYQEALRNEADFEVPVLNGGDA